MSDAELEQLRARVAELEAEVARLTPPELEPDWSKALPDEKWWAMNVTGECRFFFSKPKRRRGVWTGWGPRCVGHIKNPERFDYRTALRKRPEGV